MCFDHACWVIGSCFKIEKNSRRRGSVAGQGGSLLSAFHHIMRACVRDSALSVVQHMAKVTLNQLLLSGSQLWYPSHHFSFAKLTPSKFQLSFSRDNLPTSAAVFYLNNASLGIVKPRKLWPWHPTSNWVPLPAMHGVSVPADGCGEREPGTIEIQKACSIVASL